MFTNTVTQLSLFQLQHNLEILRDCDFAYVGKVPTKLQCRLVPCSNTAHVKAANADPEIAGVITTPELASAVSQSLGLATSPQPYSTAMAIHEALCELPDFHWAQFPTQISPDAKVHPSATVHPVSVTIGPGSVVSPHVVICERTIIGKNSTIGPGTIVGCDAFEVTPGNSTRRILRQAGGVRIADNVDIQAKCTIVRATFGGFTEIGDESKFDCQVHLAHDCNVGRRVQIAACGEVSGRVTIEDDVFIGPNATLSNGITIGASATVTLGSVVVRDVAPSTRVTGNFALPHEKWIRLIRLIK
jgi:UDP-3-O-[3-hydroxymyristoyl] glucosamine N-acyltransferase LpxD